MTNNITVIRNEYGDYLVHHGIKGQKWGVRRYQNADGTLTAAGKKRYLNDMARDQDAYFKSKISKNAAKVTSIDRNGYDSRGQAWNDAYRKGKVTSKDDQQIKSAARETRKYMVEKYGKSAVDELAKSSVWGHKIGDFEIIQNARFGKDAASQFVDTGQNEPGDYR